MHIWPYWEPFQNNQNVYNHKQTNTDGYIGGIYSYNEVREADFHMWKFTQRIHKEK